MGARRALVGAAKMPGVAWSFSRLGYRRRAANFTALDRSQRGKRFLISGANAGIGFAIAERWARCGAEIWLLCRSQSRGEQAQARLQSLGDAAVHLALVDLSVPDSVDAFLDSADISWLDAVVHNAGTLVHEYRESAPGLEETLACHVVGPHRLNHGLRPALEAAPDGRVIYMSSGGMYAEPLSVPDLLDPPRPFDGVRTYARAKRAQVVMAELWAERCPAISFFSMHPGWVDTGGVRTALPGFYRATRRWLRTPEEGADTAVWLSVTENLPVDSGAFVFDRSAADKHMLPGTADGDQQRGDLWTAIEALTG